MAYIEGLSSLQFTHRITGPLKQENGCADLQKVWRQSRSTTPCPGSTSRKHTRHSNASLLGTHPCSSRADITAPSPLACGVVFHTIVAVSMYVFFLSGQNVIIYTGSLTFSGDQMGGLPILKTTPEN